MLQNFSIVSKFMYGNEFHFNDAGYLSRQDEKIVLGSTIRWVPCVRG